MSLQIQYDLFQDNDEISDLKREILAIKESSDNVRRGLFTRLKKQDEYMNNLLSMILKQQDELVKLRELMIRMKK